MCKELLEILLHIKIDRLEKPQSERYSKDSFESKSVRFDVYTQDEKRVFDLEMQTAKNSNLPKRARYYQSAIDTESLSAGTNFSKLKDSYVIFLCMDDIFGKKLPVYRFENLCLNEKDDKNEVIKLNDRAFKVFFNASDCDKLDDIREKNFFKFLKGESAEDDFTRRLQERVKLSRKNQKWRRQYFMWINVLEEEKEIAREEARAEGLAKGLAKGLAEGLEEGRTKGRAEGLAEGRVEGLVEGRAEGEHNAHISAAENLLKMNLGSPEQIAEATQLPLDEVLAIREKLTLVSPA